MVKIVEKIKYKKEETIQNEAIQKLKTNELKYRVLAENLPQKIFLKDTNSVYVFCNNNFAKDLKIRADDIAGKTDYDFFPKNLAEQYRADDKRILKSGETEDLEEDYIQNGKRVFVHTVKTPIKDENGNNIGILGIFWDITESKIAEQKIEESEKKFRTLTKNIPGMIYRAKPDWSTEIITSSEAICGYSSEEFNSQEINWFDIIHFDDKERIVNESSKMLSGPMELIQEYRIRTKNKSTRWVEDHKISFFHEDGSFSGIDGVVFDITNRKEMEQKLEESEEWLSTLLKSIGDGVIAIDIDGIITFLNPIAESLTGWAQENAIGQHIDNVFKIINEFTQNSVENPALKALQENTVNRLSRYSILISKDKREIHIDDTGAPIKDNEGNIIGAVLIFKDTTERRIAEKKLQESEHNLEERVKELTCLYRLSKLVENPDSTIEDVLQGILDQIPSALQFPDITCVKIIFNNEEYKTSNFKETKRKLSYKTITNKRDLVIEVFYLEDKPFLKEEEYLINVIGNRLRIFIEQKYMEHKFKFLFETSPNSIFLMDMDGKVRDCNPKGEELFGYDRNELIGEFFIKFSWFLPETMPLVLKTFKTLISGRIPEPIELQQKRKDGTLIWVYVLFSFLNIGGEKLIQVITQDITKLKEAEQKLRESEEKFRTITSSAQDAIIQINHNGEIVYWNKSAENIFGYSSEEVLSRNIVLLIPERFRETFRNNFLEISESAYNISTGSTIEAKGLRKDGTEFSTELSFSVFYLDGNRNSISIVRDITERKLYEKHLKQAHNQIEQIFNASIPMYVIDVDYNIIKVNERYCKLFHMGREEMVGKKCYDIWDGSLCNSRKCSLKKIKNGLEYYEYEAEKTLKDGSKIFCIVNNYPFINQNQLIGCIKSFTDITTRKIIEHKLKASKEKYKSVLENIKEGYFEVDIFGNFTFLNEGLCETLGYSYEELINAHYSKVFDKKNKNLIFNVFNSLYKAGEGFTIYDCEATKKSGKKIFIASSTYLKHDNKGKIMGFKGFVRNVTERKQAEILEKEFNKILESEVLIRTRKLNEALKQQKLYLDQIIKASNFKSKFLATISHELRTPLNAIIGFTDLLLEGVYGNLNQEQLDFIKDIKNSAEHQYEMIKHILDISKIESGQVSIKIERIHLRNLIEQIVSSLKPLHREKNIKIELKNLDLNSIIFADRIKFKQIIYNLLSNALKFTEKGVITLEFKDKKKKWEFDVTDTGIGIAEEDYNIIFKDFKRVKSSYVDSKPGSGLGLALTKRIINLHGGDISFTSLLGKGTIFTFNIPKNFKKHSTRRGK